MKAKKIPVTKAESNNFYFLVKVCGISPLDIPHMTPFQVKTLIYQHNKHEEEKEKQLEKVQKKYESNSPRPRRARLRRRR